jgi:hypothetical protein
MRASRRFTIAAIVAAIRPRSDQPRTDANSTFSEQLSPAKIVAMLELLDSYFETDARGSLQEFRIPQ